MKREEQPPPSYEDDDLDSYLDNVLDEFNASSTSKQPPLQSSLPEAPGDTTLDEDFANQLAKGMEELMADMEAHPEDVKKSLEQMVQKMQADGMDTSDDIGRLDMCTNNKMNGAGISSSSSNPPNIPQTGSLQDKIAETMNKLKTSSEAVDSQVQAGMDQDLMQQMMKQMELLVDSGDFNNMLENMMETLLSKDILYEPMKDLKAKYPTWLRENKSKLAEEDYARYTKQLRYVEQLVAAYDSSNPNSEESTKRIVELMQGMQECGNPPPEILKELAPGLELGTDGTPKLPDMNDKDCLIM
ncbi:hypothetical protein SeMB42_g01124 [Synchytrium endobioticum]|uniref:Pex19 protein n=1 Tax=Synchytrium endobioticum TaxID=286115 RepID=A0A507DMQ4_9FUNG|nr:hypothetical protein SeLEV6574_g04990 [Synchytrium endobioticum]TPX52873.1 hypothetical protein SeMB42_g01124 [Synchytrium endobioticum]